MKPQEMKQERPPIVFVLLQYRDLDQTLVCVRSLLPFVFRGEAEIVVVDNFSAPGVVDRTKRELGEQPRVHLIPRSANDGYARGNNEGYRFAREQLGAQCIAVLNNDTEILQNDFCQRVWKVYQKTRFSILGPDIRVQDGRRVLHQNPSLRALSPEEIRLRLARLCEPLSKKPSTIPGRFVKTWLPRRNLVLHGAALIFSPRFIADFEEPFDPRTFLYEEERILYHRAVSRGHDLWYHPSPVVWHRTQVKDYKARPDYQAWRQSVKAQSYKTLLSVLEEAPSYSLPANSADTSGN